MKPVLVLQHLSGDGPAYLGRWLQERSISFEVRDSEAGDVFPESIEGYRAIAILGGEMSANDPLPSLRRAEVLFLQALRAKVPTLGHCLGGQLMARALGARIGDSPAPEVGFHEITLRGGDETIAWFGSARSRRVFQWHYEAFELPSGAQPLATSAACAQQAFSLGPHLAMQFHIEVDAEKVTRWSQDDGERYLHAMAQDPATVHDGERIRRDAAQLLSEHHALADRIYGRWIATATSA
ncbi:MAG: type 1 glutamine amidotransferase [Rubrivivax sp.]